MASNCGRQVPTAVRGKQRRQTGANPLQRALPSRTEEEESPDKLAPRARSQNKHITGERKPVFFVFGFVRLLFVVVVVLCCVVLWCVCVCVCVCVCTIPNEKTGMHTTKFVCLRIAAALGLDDGFWTQIIAVHTRFPTANQEPHPTYFVGARMSRVEAGVRRSREGVHHATRNAGCIECEWL